MTEDRSIKNDEKVDDIVKDIHENMDFLDSIETEDPNPDAVLSRLIGEGNLVSQVLG